MAQLDKDLVPGWNIHTSPVRSPVMPGGLFAMRKDFFFKLGMYDPEIKYYGAEHVELSFKVRDQHYTTPRRASPHRIPEENVLDGTDGTLCLPPTL